MMSNIRPSMTLRRPRAPVSFDRAMRAISRSDSGVKSSCAFSSWKNFWYCLTSEFLGSVMMCTRSSSDSGCRALSTGSRPTSSGIIPNSITSSTVACCSSLFR